MILWGNIYNTESPKSNALERNIIFGMQKVMHAKEKLFRRNKIVFWGNENVKRGNGILLLGI